MPDPFYKRLRAYYREVANVLRGEASSAAVFPNSTDIGISREQIYVEFLRQHAPSKCNVFAGGFLFGVDGSESKQIDVIITTDTAPRFDFTKQRGGKSFSPVEGTLGVAAIKSKLNKGELNDALSGLASIPLTPSLGGVINPLIKIRGYEDWPYKVIYATSGISLEKLAAHLCEFYAAHPEIPITRQPNLIHVAGKYSLARIDYDITIDPPEVGHPVPNGYYAVRKETDLQAIALTLHSLQRNASLSTHIMFDYSRVQQYESGEHSLVNVSLRPRYLRSGPATRPARRGWALRKKNPKTERPLEGIRTAERRGALPEAAPRGFPVCRVP